MSGNLWMFSDKLDDEDTLICAVVCYMSKKLL